MQSLKVELLTYADIVWFAEVAATRMLLEEVKRPQLYNLARIYELSQMTITQGTSWVVKEGNTPVGAIAGLMHPALYNPALNVLTELFWYVLPEYRKGRAGYLLLKAIDEKAKESCDSLVLSLLPSSEVNYSSLGKMGLHPIEQSLCKDY